MSRVLKNFRRNQRGALLVLVMVFGAIVTTTIMGGVASYSLLEHRAANRVAARDEAFHIAEAGINYYRWHLAHSPTDYTDGTGNPGPYVHEYEDKDGEVQGYFSLEITPPVAGTTVVILRSTGWTVAQPEATRTIQVRLGFPALTDHVYLTTENIAYGAAASVHGAIHSNGGIRFDGTTDSWVRSAKTTYTYSGQSKPGVWGAGGPSSFFEYPVAPVSFTAISADLAGLLTIADGGGTHLTSSGAEGWHIVFTTSTYKLYRVTSRDCYRGQGTWKGTGRNRYWDGETHCYDIGNETLVGTNPLPGNGVIFVEDDVWVQGVVDGRVTVAVGRFPTQPQTYQEIYIVGDLTYAQAAGDDVIGLLAQGTILFPYEIPNTVNVHAALLSQFGKTERPFYDGNIKQTLNIFGSEISNLSGYYWYGTSGFQYRNYTYDGNLRYYPPIGFPVSPTYELISWEEIE